MHRFLPLIFGVYQNNLNQISMHTDRIKVILADANQLIRVGTRSLLADTADIEIIGETDHVGGVVRLAEDYQPDILIAGLNMPPFTDHSIVKAAKEACRPMELIILTNKTDSRLVRQLLRSGIRGFLLKTAGTRELNDAIRDVAAGGFYIHQQIKDIFMERLIAPRPEPLCEQASISRREKEILGLIVKEFVNNEIAEELHISIHTVETHRKKLLQKTGSRNTAGLVRYAVENGIC